MAAPRTRITAGTARGRSLKTRPGRSTRPTTSLVREALFNIIGESIRGARVLDLFAGAGTLGLEALSRGAERATFVERARACATIVAENLAATGYASQAEVACADVIDWLATHRTEFSGINLILLDPPYHDPILDRALLTLDETPLRPQALVVAEHHCSDPLPELRRLRPVEARDYGTTRLSFLRYEP
jgi:16S rRNA (guanine966-N2)-methyltransferase